MDDPPPPLRRAARCWVAAVAVQVAAVLAAATVGPGPGGVYAVGALVLVLLGLVTTLTRALLRGHPAARPALAVAGAVGALVALLPPGEPGGVPGTVTPLVVVGLGITAGVLTVAAVLTSFHPACSAYLRVPRGRSAGTDG
ncbi:hypothetical protein ND486_07470 [Pseudonocardia sp. DR1-2]|uniref:hypothetical protein n=1 Tax=Pseudonocardia sp. DR1-2 TaxID=2951168 RepID=UPI0020449DC8|nr:hypothetical protein [Pseudonocardia sp. DR1-2]MCM3846030.1 hypothetical protein [Pseudonocardia sp. DR1-2]